MSTPLVDVDANPRQPGFKSIRQGSKIPSLPRFQRSGSTGRRSPFSVSMTGSPSYIAMPTTARAIVSPTPTSKLPRKPTLTQDAFSKSYTYGSRPATPRSSLPRARGGHKPSTTAVPPTSNGVKTIPPLSCNKPLPSPPIAQFVNPASPPKAQRTLVDAEAGTPTEEQWPILRPENVSITKLSIAPRIDGLPQRSVSEGSALRRNGIPVLMTRTTTPLSASNSTPSQTSASLTSNADLSHEKFKQMTEPRTFSFTNPYARSFHALSTNAEVAIDSPLAHKHRTPPAVLIPPRVSSKRSSLPLPDTLQDGSPAPPLSASLCPIKPGSTKWPVLETASDNPSKEHKIEEGLNSPQPHVDAEPQISKPVPAGSAGSPQSYYGSIDSVSTRSLAAGSSLNDELGIEHEGTVRVKCLSWHPSNPNAGPTLRISSDADAILLGRGEYIPAVPILPESIIGSRNQERSLRTLTEQVSKQTRVKTTSSTGSRTPTPTSEDKTVKITPIRSMQPPRTLSTGDLSKKSISSGTPAPTAEVQDTEAPISTRANSSSLVETSQQTSLSQINVDVAPQPSNQCQSHSLEAGRSSPIVQGEMPQKTMQMLGSTGPPKSATCKRLPMTWMTPKSATSVLKNSNTPRSKTTPLLPSVERLHNRVSAPSIRSPSSASSGLSRSTPSQAGARRTSSSRLGAAHLVTQDLTDGYCDNLDEQTQEVGQPPVDTSLRIKAKRSLRNIFYRRDAQHTPVSARKQESKRSSIAGSALAQRIRDSTNFSRVNLARPVGAKSENKQDVTITSERVVVSEKKTDRQAALSAIGSGLAEASPQSSTMAHYDTGSVVHKILDRVMSMGADSPNRLCGLEIAEAVLHAVECSKRAKRSAELAIKHAHDAELNAWRVSNELRRLEKLCEPGFDKETIMAIKQLIMATGTLDQPGSAEE